MMSKKKQFPEVLPPSTTGSVPTEKIKSAVQEVAEAREKKGLPRSGVVRHVKLRFLSDRVEKATRPKDRPVQ